MATTAHRIAAGLAALALGVGAAACSDREDQNQGNPGNDPASGDTVLRTAETAAPGNAPVAPTTPEESPAPEQETP